MPKRSIRFPLRLSGGRVLMTDDPTDRQGNPSESLEQIIRNRCQDGASLNPFRREVEAGDHVFSPMDGRTTRQIETYFRRALEPLAAARRARFVSLSVHDGGESGTLRVRVAYIDLETNERRDLEVAA